jgi:hypothetical protein
LSPNGSGDERRGRALSARYPSARPLWLAAEMVLVSAWSSLFSY